MTELSNVTQRPQMVSTNETKIKTDQLNATILQLTNNLLNINETLSRDVQWVAEDQKKDHVSIQGTVQELWKASYCSLMLNSIFLKEMLVSLQETTQNVSMRVISLERECVRNTELKVCVIHLRFNWFPCSWDSHLLQNQNYKYYRWARFTQQTRSLIRRWNSWSSRMVI